MTCGPEVPVPSSNRPSAASSLRGQRYTAAEVIAFTYSATMRHRPVSGTAAMLVTVSTWRNVHLGRAVHRAACRLHPRDGGPAPVPGLPG
ncbi:MAG: hypothetical protein ACRDOI_12755 [Trebonia sp.]